jgi:DNA primase
MINIMSKHRYADFRDAIDVDAFEEAIGFTPSRREGENDIGFCLWPDNHKHGDTTGKFAIHRGKKLYNCYVCGGGSLLSLAMELYGFDVDEATVWLKQFANSSAQSDASFQAYLLELLEDLESRQETMPYFNPRVLERFNDDRSYFHERGISTEIMDKYHLCYSNRTMKSAPIKQKGDEKIKIDEDYYGPAAIFPHFWQGKLVGWQSRWMEYPDTPKWLAKYTNTTDFPKSTTLFNYDEALKAARPVVVVESIPTVLFLASFDIPAISFFGSQPKEPQLRLMRRFHHGVILAPDNDDVGDKMVRVTTNYLEPFIPVWHAEKVEGEPGADLGDYAELEHPYHALHYHLDHKIHPSLDVSSVL